jgi:tetratricopeptide (TPR) repeat protein/nitrate/TMAO reductase-like tetraheme cytochrome c subunit
VIRIFILGLCLLALAGGWILWAVVFAPPGFEDLRPRVEAGFRPHAITSQQCIECHAESHADWLKSHHAKANRRLSKKTDWPLFHPPHEFSIAGVPSRIGMDRGAPFIRTLGPEGDLQKFYPDMVLAFSPLHQYLIPFPGGRWQTTDLAWETTPGKTGEWFNVFGDENRRPEEWGSWSNRANTWNSNCAWCHMTAFSKNYEPETDSFNSKWDEMGISCTQCHRGMEQHLKNPEAPLPTIDPYVIQETCATCHSRREELTLDFQADDHYYDHFRLSLPSQYGLYYPDGQIRDEVFVYGSLMFSRMGHAGIHCLDCHKPHSGELKLPATNDAMCLSCHAPPGDRDATVIDLAKHSFHDPVSSGGPRCIDCHMTATKYMQRDPRRDHGFHIPDPLLTVRHGVPNACNKCHTAENETPEWALEWTEKWWGEKMDRPTRVRSLLVARAYDREIEVVPELIAFAETEENPYWQATLLELAANLDPTETVRRAAVGYLQHQHPIVRSSAIRSLAPFREHHPTMEPLLEDPVRLVRLDASNALQQQLLNEKRFPEETRHYYRIHADQPSGQARLGQLAYMEGRLPDADAHYVRAIEWDPYSWPLYRDLAVMRSTRGNNPAALKILEQGVKANPDQAGLHYYYALALAEGGRMGNALRQLRKTVELDPAFARAWYNLGLLQNQQGEAGQAIDALTRAIAIEPDEAHLYYTRATIYLGSGNPAAARLDAEKALEIQPGYQPAQQLLQTLP